MKHPFNYKTLALAVASFSAAMSANAAGLDRSGQDVTAFLQDGTYAEVVYTYIDADVSGKDIPTNNAVGDIAESYDYLRYGVKTDINDKVSIGVLYDEPFAAAVQYSGNNNFVNQTNGQGTNVEIRTNNITALAGLKFGPNNNFQVYGGPAAQRLDGEVHLRGAAYSQLGGIPAVRYNGYDANIKQDTEIGWVAGIAYSKPEIALKAALTYRSEIEHESSIYERAPIDLGSPPVVSDFSVTLPESWNLDFQTGVNPTTLLTAKVRYVPWSDFEIRPTRYSSTAALNPAFPNGLPIVSYADDQWQVELGLGKRLTDRLAVSGSLGWDSGAGDPATTLGPIDGYYSVGLGAKYNFTPEWSVSLGGKYLQFGDAKSRVPTGTIVGNFEDNDGYVLGLKVAYQGR